MKSEDSGVSHASVMVKADTIYNLITTDPSQAFSAYLFTTHHEIEDYQYTKGVNIGYKGMFMSHDYFPRKRVCKGAHSAWPSSEVNVDTQVSALT